MYSEYLPAVKSSDTTSTPHLRKGVLAVKYTRYFAQLVYIIGPPRHWGSYRHWWLVHAVTATKRAYGEKLCGDFPYFKGSTITLGVSFTVTGEAMVYN